MQKLMHDFKKELDCCYRVDTYSVGWKKGVKPPIFEEYFVRGGENCILQFPNLENTCCYIHLYDEIIPYDIPLDVEEDEEIEFDSVYYSKLIESINKLRQILMVYDYCLGKLREIDNLEERKDSPFFNAKYMLEALMNSKDYFDFDFEEIGFSDKLIAKLNKRCEYLAYASKLEWKGVIKLSTMNKFRSIEALENHVKANNLHENPEGKVGSKVVGFIGKADENQPDPLADCRDVDGVLEHYQTSRKLKSKKALKLADALEEEMQIVYVFSCYAQEVSDKMNAVDSNSEQYKTLTEEYKKSIDICKENGARISLLVNDYSK